MKTIYIIWRHSGRDGAPWREVSNSHAILNAMEIYEKEHSMMRVGGVQLRQYDDGSERGIDHGKLIKKSWAPRLRSKW